MNAFNNAAQEAVEAAALPADDEKPLDLHHEYKLASECGYTQELKIHEHEAGGIAARLRGAGAITAILMTEGLESMALGGYLRGGLLDALHVLISDASATLEKANERTYRKKVKA